MIERRDSLIRLLKFLLSILLILTFNPLYPIWGKCTISIPIFGDANVCGCTLNYMLGENYIGSASKTLALITAICIVVSFVVGLLSFSCYFRYKKNKVLDLTWEFITLATLIFAIIFFSNYLTFLLLGIFYLIIYLISLVFTHMKYIKNK